MNEPTKSVNAVLLPNCMAPNAVHNVAANTVAGIGQLRFSFTLPKNFGKGVALSLASAHQILDTVRNVPKTQIIIERKIINNSPKVAPLLPVAWEYTTARGKLPLELVTAERSLMPYKMAMA